MDVDTISLVALKLGYQSVSPDLSRSRAAQLLVIDLLQLTSTSSVITFGINITSLRSGRERTSSERR